MRLAVFGSGTQMLQSTVRLPRRVSLLGLVRALNEPIEADALVPSLEGDWFWKVLYTPSEAVRQSMPGRSNFTFMCSLDALEPATDEAK